MAVLKESEAQLTHIKEGITRRLLHTRDLMMVVIDFDNGPWSEPDPAHQHIHEQTSYVAEGQIIFFCEGEPAHYLNKGDMFCVPSGKQHAIQLLSARATLVDSFTPIRKDFL